MTTGLSSNGKISLDNISVEVLKTGGNQVSINEANIRTLFAQTSGTIKFSQGYGKRWITPGNSATYTSSTTITVPARYQTFTIVLNAGGGGSGGGCGNDGFVYGYCGGCGGTGGTTSFNDTTYTGNNTKVVEAYGGYGGCAGSTGSGGSGANGSVTVGRSEEHTSELQSH